MSGTPTATLPRLDAPAYRDAYSRINGLVIVGEGMADRHFRRLAALLPEQRDELLRLLAPLHEQFLEAERQGDLVSCLVIQCLIIECFAVAAYRLYLPVADAYAQPITAAVMRDGAEHLNFGEQWLRPRFAAVVERVEACAGRAVPVALAMLSALEADLRAIDYGAREARRLLNRLTARALS